MQLTSDRKLLVSTSTQIIVWDVSTGTFITVEKKLKNLNSQEILLELLIQISMESSSDWLYQKMINLPLPTQITIKLLLLH